MTSRSGYKLLLVLYPNGYGIATGSYMSLFIVLLRSNFDPILKFPLDGTVQFTLYDQTSTGQSVFKSFLTRDQPTFFGKPTSEANAPYGISNFVQLDRLTTENSRFIVEDSIFIKTSVDFSHLSNVLSKTVVHNSPAQLRSDDSCLHKDHEDMFLIGIENFSI